MHGYFFVVDDVSIYILLYIHWETGAKFSFTFLRVQITKVIHPSYPLHFYITQLIAFDTPVHLTLYFKVMLSGALSFFLTFELHILMDISLYIFGVQSIKLTDYSWLQIYKNCPWNIFSCTSFTEECCKGVITNANRFIRWHLAVGLNPMFETIQLPTSITF